MAMRLFQFAICAGMLSLARGADATLRVDSEGHSYYADPPAARSEGGRYLERFAFGSGVTTNTIPVSPFPASLIFHSRAGAANVLFLNFGGEVISNSVWNVEVGRPGIVATAFSLDEDFATFSETEQVAIKEVWQRVAEDFAPFNIDVTTERPASFGLRTAHALITKNAQANGLLNPTPGAGGLSHVNVFNTADFARERPVWIYFNNLGKDASFIAEAISHEIGHNLGLSHDGTTHSEYYAGHGSGETSWAPIMGTAYNYNVTQWSKGDYYQANNFEDDLATIAAKLTYAPDDHPNTLGGATPLIISNGTNIVSATGNKGIIEQNTDVDFFSLVVGSGPAQVVVDPLIMPSGTRGNNLDIQVDFCDGSGLLMFTADTLDSPSVVMEGFLPQGVYYFSISGTDAGDPFSSTPSGYTKYGSLGHYFISGYVSPLTGLLEMPGLQNVAAAGMDVSKIVLHFDSSVDLASVDGNEVEVTGPHGYKQLAELISAEGNVATYAARPGHSGAWVAADNGIYQATLLADTIADGAGGFLARTVLGMFKVDVPPATVSPLQVKTSVNNAAFGAVALSEVAPLPGTVIDVTAVPAAYYRFVEWTGDLAGSFNPISLLMGTNKSVVATFAEILTAHHPTPLWWLAQFGATNNFELTVDSIGANGMALWESYIAGLNPSDPNNGFRLRSSISAEGYVVLNWSTVEGRFYTIQVGADAGGPFLTIQGAEDLAATVHTYNQFVDPDLGAQFFRVVVRKP